MTDLEPSTPHGDQPDELVRVGGVLVRPGQAADAAEAEHGPVAYEPDRYPVDDPGIEEHLPRPTDVDESAARRAARHVTFCFGLVPVLAIAFVVFYYAIPRTVTIDFGPLHTVLLNLLIGLTLGLAVLLIGIGAILWARTLMSDQEIVDTRHPLRSTEQDRAEVMADVNKGISDSAITRRKMLGRSLLGAVGILAAPAVVVLVSDLGPAPTPSRRKVTIERTLWSGYTPDGKGELTVAPTNAKVRVVTDITFEPLKPEQLQIGTLVTAEPANLQGLDGTDQFNVQKAKAAIILVRMDPNSVKIPAGRENWNVDGIFAYSKICTHVGCAINLWEQQTHHLLCPCHQSTFDLGDGGKVVFGPAARALPQLPLTVDDEGYLVAQRDFPEPVGPSYFERDYYPEDGGQ